MNSRLDDLKKIVSSQTDNPRSHFELGCAAQAQGELELAVECFTKVTQLAGQVAAGHFNLGNACFSLKRYRQASIAYQQAFELNPDRGTLNNLGNAYAAMGDFGQAIQRYEQALTWPDDGTAIQTIYKNLARAWEAAGDRSAAATVYRQLIAASNDSDSSPLNLFRLVRQLAEFDTAGALQELESRVVEVEQSPELLALKGDCHLARHDFEQSLRSLMLASDIAPDHPAVLASLGLHYLQRGRHFESLVCLHRALASGSYTPAIHSAWLYCQLLQEPLDVQRFLQEAKRWDPQDEPSADMDAPVEDAEDQVRDNNANLPSLTRGDVIGTPSLTRPDENGAPSLTRRVVIGTPSLTRRVVMGIVAGASGLSKLKIFLEPLIALAVAEEIRLSIYADCDDEELSALVKNHSAHVNLQTTSTWGDNRLRQVIKSDGIDVLIDLAGHGLGNRLSVFALRSAPRQVSWAGWLATSGLQAMDVLVADEITVLENENDQYTEEVRRLSRCMFSCMPPALDSDSRPRFQQGSVDDSRPPFQRGFFGDSVSDSVNDHLIATQSESDGDRAHEESKPSTALFGSVCSPAQLSDKLLSIWCKLLKQEPTIRLRVADPAYRDESLCAEIREKFRTREVDPSRIELVVAEPIDLLSSVSVTLDPLPWNSAEITCQSLLLGTPVIAWRGDRLSCRTSASVLAAAGLEQWIVASPEDYCQRAHEVAQANHSRLRLRQHVSQSSLCNWRAWADEFLNQLVHGSD